MKQHFKDLIDHLENCQFTTYGVLCPKRSCHHCTKKNIDFFSLFFFLAGKSLAIKYGCKYIETSPGINHNVDELLVGMLTQIQLREKSQCGEGMVYKHTYTQHSE